MGVCFRAQRQAGVDPLRKFAGSRSRRSTTAFRGSQQRQRRCCGSPGTQCSASAYAFPAHGMTASARNNIDLGTSRYMAFAVARFIVSWNLIGCSMGSSAAFAPLRILST